MARREIAEICAILFERGTGGSQNIAEMVDSQLKPATISSKQPLSKIPTRFIQKNRQKYKSISVEGRTYWRPRTGRKTSEYIQVGNCSGVLYNTVQ